MSAPDPIAAAQQRALAGRRPRRRPETTTAGPAYAGLVTRAVAFAIDAAIVNVVSLATSAIVGLGLSVLYGTIALHDVLVVLGGALYACWSVGYFVVLWAAGGQTVGSRVMRIRVVDAATGEALGGCRALARFAGLTLGAIPLLAGFLMLLWDDRRRGLHDRLARSVVVHVAPSP